MLEAHFRAVADEGDLPIVVYNVPSRTGANVDADTFLRLAEHPRVIAVKEASGNIEQIARICRDRPRDVAVLAGDDAWTLPILALGGDGVVSVASNEIPGELVALCAAAHAGDWDAARRIHERWLPLFLANFRGGPNPVPVKAALARWACSTATPSGPRCCRWNRTARAATGGHAARPRPRRRPAAGRDRRPWRPSHDRGVAPSRRSLEPSRARCVRLDPRPLLDDLEAGPHPRRRARTRRPRTAGASGPTSRPRSSQRFRDRTTGDVGGRPADASATGRRSRHATCATARGASCPGGTAVRRGAYLGDGRRRDAAELRQRRGVGRRRHDGRLARARRVVRPDRRARPSRGGRDDRRRARAAGRPAGHRRGRGVRRRGLRPARWRARRPGPSSAPA